MMKYLLLIGLLLIVFWGWRKARTQRDEHARHPASRAPEKMVTCAHCGVNLPISDSLPGAGNRHFCCNEHRQAAESRKN